MPSAYRIALGPLSRIFADWWREGRLSVLFLALSIPAAALLSVAAPYVFSRLIDDLPSDPVRWMAAFSFYAVLVALASALQRGTQYLAMMHAEKLSFIASTLFFERLIRKRPAFFADHNPAEIQSAASQGAETARALMHVAFNFFLPAVATVLFVTATLGAVISMEIIVIVVLYGTLFLGLTLAANRVTTRWLTAAIEAGQENARFIGNAVGMIEPLRHSGSDGWMRERFAESAAAVFRNWRAYSLRRIGFIAILSLALALQFVVTYWLLLPRYRAGEISVGDLVLFNMLLLQLNSPFEMIGMAITETARALAGFAPFARMWAAPEEESRDRQPLRLARGVIDFEDVGFRYDNGRGVEGVSFRAGPGRITFITGETGSGKSTLFKLLQKSMAPQRGRIAVDGQDLSAIGRDEWFAAVGIVPQEVMLLNDSLRVNIVLGRAFDPQRLRRAAARAAILERIEAMPEGFETVVGERGLKLSGGERQRIAIARALYADPAILLLDEASSALDEATEREIMEQLRGVDREMTIVAITHRQSSIGAGDHVVALPPPSASKG